MGRAYIKEVSTGIYIVEYVTTVSVNNVLEEYGCKENDVVDSSTVTKILNDRRVDTILEDREGKEIFKNF